MKKITLIGLLFASIVGCQSDDGAQVLNTNENLTAINFSEIGKENLYGNGAEDIPASNVVINDAASWGNLLGQVNNVNPVSPNFSETNIDFTASTVIAIFDEIRPSAGYEVEVASIAEVNGVIVVDVENHDGGAGAGAAVMTQPFHIVKIPHTTLPVTFE